MRIPSSGREGACRDISDPYGVYVTGGAGDEREYKEDDACHLRDVTDGHGGVSQAAELHLESRGGSGNAAARWCEAGDGADYLPGGARVFMYG